MKNRVAGLIGIAAAVAAAALVAAVQAGARAEQATGAPPAAQYVSAYVIRGKMSGSLKGSLKWTGPNAGFDAFLKGLEYNPTTGIMSYRVPERFAGTLAGVGKGTLTMDATTIAAFKPGTTLYDFSTYPSPQPGTTGDPKQWLGGWGVHRITGGTGVFKGASGSINHRDIRVLTDANLWGIVRLKNGS
jgi:hypothetical protein